MSRMRWRFYTYIDNFHAKIQHFSCQMLGWGCFFCEGSHVRNPGTA